MADKIEGYLEVGCNERGEVVVNHPDLTPDADGVGHIVFSPNQARNLAALLLKHAAEADADTQAMEATARRIAAEAIPVDRAAVVLTDGSQVTEDHREIDPASGQQKGYVVLTAEERTKGFVRPVRQAYRHVGASGPRYPLRDLDDEQRERYESCGYVKYEEYPESESPACGRYWTQKQLDEVGKGCWVVTTMSLALAETYARDPSFYGGTFCVQCREHFPVDQFVWAGSNERVGS